MRLKNLRRSIPLLFLLAIAGCEKRLPAAAVDIASIRCPELDGADVARFSERPVPAPKGGMTVPKLKAWVDARKLQLMRVQHAGTRVATQYNACRTPGGDPQAGS